MKLNTEQNHKQRQEKSASATTTRILYDYYDYDCGHTELSNTWPTSARLDLDLDT